MRLYKTLLVLCGLLISSATQAQSVISFMGGTLESSTMTLSFTAGEALVGNFSGNSISVAGGFSNGNDLVSTSNEIPKDDLPVTFRLRQNYPNPFNPSTNISFDLPRSSEIRLEVFNSIGAKVAILAEGRKPAGSYTLRFNASTFASGMYFYRFIADGKVISTQKMLLIK
ncbi:T9SS type A sorting domain-containing protein [Gracilimonas sp.]|uniref:T9SS type A sorting domain-containing protein n=1 Tax=Gracilimonas sp. TaxID=1974203 RepID=UPI0032EBEE48